MTTESPTLRRRGTRTHRERLNPCGVRSYRVGDSPRAM